MSRLSVLSAALALLLASGCMTVRTTRAYNGIAVEDGRTPVVTVEIENSGWYQPLFAMTTCSVGTPWSVRRRMGAASIEKQPAPNARRAERPRWRSRFFMCGNYSKSA